MYGNFSGSFRIRTCSKIYQIELEIDDRKSYQVTQKPQALS